jgi:hypothetical protein
MPPDEPRRGEEEPDRIGFRRDARVSVAVVEGGADRVAENEKHDGDDEVGTVGRQAQLSRGNAPEKEVEGGGESDPTDRALIARLCEKKRHRGRGERSGSGPARIRGAEVEQEEEAEKGGAEADVGATHPDGGARDGGTKDPRRGGREGPP